MRSRRTAGRLATAFLWRFAALSIIWLVIVNGTASSWWIGGPAVVLAAAATLPINPSFSIEGWGLLRFMPFFVGRAFAGGMDVAWRALHPRLPLAPELIEYPLHLPQGLPQVVMANIVNLLPGTLITKMEADALQVHIIDRHAPYMEELQAVESVIARIFGIKINQSEI